MISLAKNKETHISPAGKRVRIFSSVPDRYVMIALCALCTCINYADRVNMSVAIIPMSQAFKLNLHEQSIVLSSFFLGYIPMQLGGAILCRRLGGKTVLTCGAFLWSLFTLATPASGDYGGMMLLVGCRVLMGLAEGVAFPSVFHFLSSWIPSHERGRAVALFLTGAHVGTMAALIVSPVIIRTLDWRFVFYIFGSIGFAWIAAWHFLARDRDDLSSAHTDDGDIDDDEEAHEYDGHLKHTLRKRSSVGSCLNLGGINHNFHAVDTKAAKVNDVNDVNDGSIDGDDNDRLRIDVDRNHDHALLKKPEDNKSNSVTLMGVSTEGDRRVEFNSRELDKDPSGVSSSLSLTTGATTATASSNGVLTSTSHPTRLRAQQSRPLFTAEELTMIKTILSDRRTISVCCAQSIFGLIHYVILSWLPTYFKNVYQAETGSLWFTFFPYLAMAIAANFGGMVADSLIRNGYNMTRVRKGVTCVACIGAGLSLLLFAAMQSIGTAVAAASLSMAFMSLNSGGFESAYMDLASPKSTGLFKAVSNTLGSFAGLLAVPLSAWMLDLLGGSWRLMFASLAFWHALLGAVFVTMFSAERVLPDEDQ